MMSHAYTKGLPAALARGAVTMADLDAAVRRILAFKFRLGLFDDPYREAATAALTAERRAAHREAARDAARRSIVLLSQKNGLLPIAEAPRRIAVLGPLADAPGEMLGPWSASGRAEEMVTFLAGLRGTWPRSDIAHARGGDIDNDDVGGIAAAVDLARSADLVVLCVGEARGVGGGGQCRGRLGLPGRQGEFVKAVLDAGKPTVVLLSSGRSLLVPELLDRAGAVLATWFLGSEAGNAVGDVLSGKWNPSGRLPVSWPADA